MYNPASALSLNQLNAIIAFDSYFESLSVSCHLPILKKKIQSALNLESAAVFQGLQSNITHPLLHPTKASWFDTGVI